MNDKYLLRTASIALGFVALCVGVPTPAQAPKDLTPELKSTREALDKYKDPVAAIHDGYFSTLGCVTYPKAGAPGEVPYPKGGMGVHFFNVALLGKPLDPTKPQVLVYEPVGDRLQLVAAEWFVPAQYRATKVTDLPCQLLTKQESTSAAETRSRPLPQERLSHPRRPA
jgi:hypothetical protein